MSLNVTLLCPHCVVPIDMQSQTRGICTRCRADLTITVTQTWSLTNINRDAPFYPLVEMIDDLTPRGRRHTYTSASTSCPQAESGD